MSSMKNIVMKEPIITIKLLVQMDEVNCGGIGRVGVVEELLLVLGRFQDRGLVSLDVHSVQLH